MTLECLYAFLTEGILTTKQKVYVYNKLFPLIKAEFQSVGADKNFENMFLTTPRAKMNNFVLTFFRIIQKQD